MPLVFREVRGNIVTVQAQGRLTDEDYQVFVPRMESLIQQWGRLRMVFEMTEEFEGWDLASAWAEFKFQARHMHDLSRVAVLGSRKWEQWATTFSRVFTGSEVRYFDRAQALEAREWISSGW